MPAISVCGSEVGGSQRNRKSTIVKEERILTESLANCLDDTDLDRQFIQSELLDGPQSRHIPKVARLLRKGVLDKVDCNGQVIRQDEQLDPRCTKFRNLKSDNCRSMLQAWEPTLADKNLDEVCRPKLMRWVCFALGVREGTDIPSDFPTLRTVLIFCDYTQVRYVEMGERLKALRDVENLAEADVPGLFDLLKDEGKIQCNVLKDNQGEPITFDYSFDGADDWVVLNNFTGNAKIHSEQMSQTTELATRMLRTTGHRLPEETHDWNIDLGRLPASVISATAATAVPATARAALSSSAESTSARSATAGSSNASTLPMGPPRGVGGAKARAKRNPAPQRQAAADVTAANEDFD